ncbi:hypothetical protein GCM10010987_43910 [Bradyrhizobium guangdongense]|uniref:Uncharacterized protein n=1 Tax=Bradyrhizobium guangdongense TaxID=1325090 RepID=A0AA87WA20_9BRAD|nr:hypothetical protein GCM10010987_43910 [Bradyrhizobium guangdongense]
MKGAEDRVGTVYGSPGPAFGHWTEMHGRVTSECALQKDLANTSVVLSKLAFGSEAETDRLLYGLAGEMPNQEVGRFRPIGNGRQDGDVRQRGERHRIAQ